MRRTRLAVLSGCLALGFPVYAQKAPATAGVSTLRPFTGFGLRHGTAVYVRTDQVLSSTTAKPKDVLTLTVQEDVRYNGLLVIAKGAKVTAKITDAHGRGRMGHGGRLDVRIDSVELVDGEKLSLRAHKSVDGGRAGEFGELMALSVLDWEGFLYWPILPFLPGDEVQIPAGTKLVAYVQGHHALEMARFDHPILQISSDPAGASIKVDGLEIGRTPLTRVLPIGEHTLQITATGREPWQKTVHLVGGSVTIAAELQLLPAERQESVPSAPR
jgi:PEGA domain